MPLDARQLELKHLHALVAVAREGSFGRAAERLGYTQSAVSQQIAALERSVGSPVFDRPGGPKAVVLTPAGTVLLDHATEIIEGVQRAVDDLDRLENGEVGRLSVASFQSASVAIVPSVMGRLMSERPQLSIELTSENEQAILMAGVIDGTLDAAFGVGETHGPKIETIRLFEDPFVVLAPAFHRPDGRQGPMSLDELASQTMIGQPDEECRFVADEFLRRLGLGITYSFTAEDNGAVQAMVRSGMGCSVMPMLAVDLDDPGVVICQLDPVLPSREVCLMLPTGRTRPPAMDRFLEITLEVCSELAVAQPVEL